MTTKQNRPAGNGTAQEVACSATEILADTWSNADDWTRDSVSRAIAFLAASGRPFTTDDLRDLGADADHPNRWGAGVKAAVTAGTIECVGFTASTRPSRHGGILRVWRGVPAGGVR